MTRQYLLILLLLSFGYVSAQDPDKGLKTDNLIIENVKSHVYRHVTYLKTETYGRVACNGMIVFDKGEAIIFDTPVDDSTSNAVIDWVENSLKCKVKAVIATHFHEDCVAGLNAFHKRGIPSYATNNTIEFAKKAKFLVPQKGFNGLLELKVGDEKVIAEFNGEGHTRDNIIGYFPSERAMFGGCLIKELDATKGNLADANVKDWSATVAKIKTKYPDTQVVIPGHGNVGNSALLDYTIVLFEVKK
ncbi:subclass B1 metallo-beta-lactamase [Dyadobacter sp. CY323]|uniref:subclass B1 metallo-beta-lactamase n=1 Tax=Dyadobacter sp. CY323 TaxID=2907302 RepID=UPI001F4048FC|nr:subclass B1 metallo-beta-lactamase [Dyadobacter sp. CY323]MCE6988039.1 subclass B1 metallo-beta-lactamase [Dyadobacter sp. CY323]